MYAMTAAHKTLPLGTCVLVTNVETGTDAVVQITDRGPYVKGRELDLSYAAANKIGILGKGTGLVTIQILGREDYAYGKPLSGCGDYEASRQSGRREVALPSDFSSEWGLRNSSRLLRY
jgi:rare lipoprotein A